MSTLAIPMASPNPLKRSFEEADLENHPINTPDPQQPYEQPNIILQPDMSDNHKEVAAPSVDSSRLSSPAPSSASSSAIKDGSTQAAAKSTTPGPKTKKPKLTFAEKEVKRIEKEFKDREKAEEKAKKEQEREVKDRERADEKAKKEEEKRVKDMEKAARRLAQEEKGRVRDEEKRKKDEDKAKKEEEKNKKARSQLRLNAFFAPPSVSNEASRDSPARESPSSSRRSSIGSLHGPGAISRERSASATPQKAQLSTYDRMFPSFFVKSHTILARYNVFSPDEDGLGDIQAKLDETLGQANSPSQVDSTSVLPDRLHGVFNNKQGRAQRLRGRPQTSVKEIIARLNGTAQNPIDLTSANGPAAAQNPLEMLKAVPVKFLKFYEDVRPPYIGTYTKSPEGRSAASLGRNPFSRTLPATNYDYDSEAEWEEPEEGEDLDSEGEEEEEEDDDANDMEGFLDDGNTEEVKKTRPIIGNLEPNCTGLCWEDSHSRICRTGSTDPPLDLSPYRIELLLDNPTLPIDPYSTIYWETKSIAKPAASPSRMDPPRIPLNAINRLNLQLPNPLPPNGEKPKSTQTGVVTSAKAPKQPQVKRYIAPELLSEFKAAVQGSELTKLGLVEVLKKQFPKQSKGAIQDTLASVAERVGGKESEKRWVLREST